MMLGLEAETQSMSPPASSWLKMGRFLTQTQIFSWSAGMCYFSYYLFNSYWSHRLDLVHLVLDHDLEVNVYLDSLRLVHLLPLCLLLPQVVHLLPSLLPVLLQSLDFIQT